ncbi:MAG TPA: NAD(P)H-hydrate dehydratase [Prolixibacteraceae bacterium]|nr:NAD(P)H-hydrate dehydratase [Prolixibacteraceae bacterium]
MKLFTTRQIADIDRYTIDHEPISELDLMERASMAISDRLLHLFSRQRKLVFLAGPGNNGGDALAVARLMSATGYPCEVYLPDLGKSGSPSREINLQRLKDQAKAKIFTISGENDFPQPEPGSIIIDGLFGSGLTRPPEGLAAALVRHINEISDFGFTISDLTARESAGKSEIVNPKSEIFVVAIDVPSGLMGEDNSGNIPENIIRAHATITLQFPKLSLLFPENEQYAGEVFTEDIGLHPDAICKTETVYQLSERDTIYNWFPPRKRFAHKGDFGHALLIGGSYGKMGAALLASEACLLMGAGLVTTHLPSSGYVSQQTYRPEVMCSIDPGSHFILEVPPLKPYQAIGIGPGLGTRPETKKAISELIARAEVPMVWDADALNHLALNPLWLEHLPQGTILTPHPGEFRRLFGETRDSWQQLQLLRKKAKELKLVIVLKGAFTAIALPNGNVWFNPTGNPGMATGGSGDVLTGIILGLLARGFSPERAARAGVFIHGKAGDMAAARVSQDSLTASDISHSLPEVFQHIYGWRQSEFSYF